jgi:hypothetical protein
MIKLADYPQLRMLAWSRPADACMDEAEAFSLYESNWRFLDQGSMQPAEAALLQRLTQAHGAGLLLV